MIGSMEIIDDIGIIKVFRNNKESTKELERSINNRRYRWIFNLNM